MSDPFVGQLMLCPYNFAPAGWADCTGQLLPIQQYTALFSLLGTNFGGDGRTNFALPDLQGRVALSQGQAHGGSQYSMGEKAGTEAVALQQSELAPHTHGLNANPTNAAVNTAGGNTLAKVHNLAPGGLYHAPPADTTLSGGAILPAGGGGGHNTMQPFLALRYIIALQGVYPSRP